MNQNGGNWTRTPTPTFGQLQRDRMQDGGMYGPNGGDARFTLAPVIPTWDPAAHVPKAPPQVQYNVANDPWVQQVTRNQYQPQQVAAPQQQGGGLGPDVLLMLIVFFPLALLMVWYEKKKEQQDAVLRRYQFHEGKWWWLDFTGWWHRYDGETTPWPPKVFPDGDHMGDWVLSPFYNGPLPGDDPLWARPPAAA